ncbi:tRNA pseudouridine(55) synthase TruB [Candidatus Gracilibacteria bacterium]|nr:tRNA pseudouridine(55) synthase TruB [Candidatus Gracilibacteria bacterium]
MTTKAFYLIDKPIGFSSFDVLRVLKKKLNIKKMGHTGTLDPLATGALLVAVGDYTKLIPYFEKDNKEYEFTVELNGVTDSYDSETPVDYISEEQQEEYKKSLTQENIQEIIENNFSGEIEQIPPKYSALKIGGKKALDKVRAGESFEMKTRKATIHEIEILSYNYPSVTIRAKVTAGTYIRSIAYDLGQIIGTGGYISYLRRTKIAKLDVGSAQILDDFDASQSFDEKLLFGENKIIPLAESLIKRLNQGLVTNMKDFQYPEGEYLVMNSDHVSNVVTYNEGVLKPKRKI